MENFKCLTDFNQFEDIQNILFAQGGAWINGGNEILNYTPDWFYVRVTSGKLEATRFTDVFEKWEEPKVSHEKAVEILEKESIEFINLTPHSIILFVHGERKEYKSMGQLRLKEQFFGEIKVGGVAINEISYIPDIPIPEIKKKTIYIVSQIVASAFSNRKDFVFPTNLIRDENGNIIGCNSLSRI